MSKSSKVPTRHGPLADVVGRRLGMVAEIHHLLRENHRLVGGGRKTPKDKSFSSIVNKRLI